MQHLDIESTPFLAGSFEETRGRIRLAQWVLAVDRFSKNAVWLVASGLLFFVEFGGARRQAMTTAPVRWKSMSRFARARLLPLSAVLSYCTMWMLLSYVDPVRVSSTGCTMAKTKPAVIDGIDESRLQGPVLAGAVGPQTQGVYVPYGRVWWLGRRR